jgi:DNA-binding NtrC family response regulator
VRGAFTGALAEHVGAFRQAERGTLFLDEIGDMSSAMQAKILRALQERIVTPVGGKPVRVDVRVIAATHRDLRDRVRNDNFREDLFYRLNVVPIHMPPLRERISDILPLAEYFIAKTGGKKQLAPAAGAGLVRHSWPGNVRELKNAMERVMILVRGKMIDAEDLGFLEEPLAGPSETASWPDEDLPTALARLEEMLIRRALRRTAGNRAEAARMLNIHRQLLYTKMRRYGLDLSEDRTSGVGSQDAKRQ